MSVVLEAIPVPLRNDGDGGLRVGQTRVSFDCVWQLHHQGKIAEEIVQAFDTLDVADVHAVLAWALRHPDEVADYLTRRGEEANELRRKLEQAGMTPTPEQTAQMKTRLLARRQQGELPREGDVSRNGTAAPAFGPLPLSRI